MKFLHSFIIFASFASVISSLDDPPEFGDVKIAGVSAIGTGCPSGSVGVELDSTRTKFNMRIHPYEASVGPGAAVSDARKSCRASVSVQYPAGYQYSAQPSR
jgi:hypothetical protein